MNKTSKMTIGVLLVSLFSGCEFKLQNLADEYINDKNVPKADIEKKEKPGANIIKSGVEKRYEKTDGQGAMQKSYDKWEKEEWNPTFANDVNQTTKDEEAKKHFTLQHYVDKVIKYQKEHPKTEPSNVDKLNAMPIIGK